MSEKREPSRLNKSGVLPCGHAVLVELYEPELKSTALIIPDTVSQRQTMIETRAIVLDIGPSAWMDEVAPRAEVGDKVLIQKYAGVIVSGTADGKIYRLINDRDIVCLIGVE